MKNFSANGILCTQDFWLKVGLKVIILFIINKIGTYVEIGLSLFKVYEKLKNIFNFTKKSKCKSNEYETESYFYSVRKCEMSDLSSIRVHLQI